jgi:hypothetical protein
MTDKTIPSGDELRMRLRQYDRTPFLDLLAIWLESAPSEDQIKSFARKNPDKWVNSLSQIARTAGFTDKTELTHNINLVVGQMSDSQLEDRLRALTHELQLPAPAKGGKSDHAEATDVEFVAVPVAETDAPG